MNYEQLVLIVYISVLVLMSLISFFLFMSDKKKAIKGRERIKEKTLLSSSVFGGALGALIGRIVCHHKTDKIYFSIVIYFSLLLQIATAVVMVILLF